MRIKVKKEVAEFLINATTKVHTRGGSIYYYIPFWFTKTEEEDIFEEFSFDSLPEELKKAIKDLRL
uniref:Uncharacterized protein n=1 Tax=viral metagenome TaxID=1070528 RepID=A0A6M3LRB3_9ZZZZ